MDGEWLDGNPWRPQPLGLLLQQIVDTARYLEIHLCVSRNGLVDISRWSCVYYLSGGGPTVVMDQLQTTEGWSHIALADRFGTFLPKLN